MRCGLGVLLALTLLSPSAAGQSEQSIQTVEQLSAALCLSPQENTTRQSLLKAYPHLVEAGLWRELMGRATAQPMEHALEIYSVAIEVASQLKDQKLLAKTYYKVGLAYSGLNQFSQAIESYEKSRDSFERAGLQRDLLYILADLGALYLLREDYGKAQDYSEQSIVMADKVKGMDVPPGTWPDAYGRGRALYTLAAIELREGNHSEAIDKLQASLVLYQSLNGQGTSFNTFIADDLAALNRVYADLGDYARALSYANQALELAKSLSDPDLLASLFNTIGFLYMEQEDYDQAKAHFDQSLKGYTALNNHREVAKVLVNLGVIEQRLEHYDEALKLFRVSVQGADATQFRDVGIAANEGIGVVLTAKRDFVGALESLKLGLKLANELLDKTRQTEILWRLAQVQYEMKDYEQAVALAGNALALARSAHLPKLTYLTATTLGQSYAGQKKFDLATQTLKQAVDQLETMRDQVAGREVERQLFFENKVTAYHALVDLLVKQGKLLDAFLYAERAKGRVLLDVLSNGRPDLANVLTRGEIDETQRLNRRLSEINDCIRTQGTAKYPSLNSLYSQLDAARLEYQSFQNALYVKHPDLSMRSGRTAVLTTADLNVLTREDNTAYLEYVAGRDHVSLFVLTKDKSNGSPTLKVYPVAIKAGDLVLKVNQFHDALAAARPTYTSAAHELYSLLIEPAKEQLRGIDIICIVPDGFLWNVPFPALMSTSDRFLIEDHAVYYAPSLSVLREMNRVDRRKTKDTSLIAFGNPVIDKDEQRNTELCPLTEAETEVKSIANSFAPTDSKVFIGREATETLFKALAPTYSVIHLATHGVIDNRQPLYSHLLLTKTEGKQENDGLLEAREIMEMNLGADLAVLSACDTANGKISPGEGVMGMSWAFFVAGTRSMLVSQWKVDSRSTSELMTNFYEGLRPNPNWSVGKKAGALKAAALNVLKHQQYRHPFYWSGFVLVGSN